MERPLKIALVSAFDFSAFGGVNSHINELAAQFRSWGHTVKVIAPCTDPGLIRDENFIPMGRPVPLPSRGSVGRVSVSVWLRPSIKRLLERERFDIIHMHEPFASYVPVGILSQSRSVNIATFHAYPGSRMYNIGGAKLARPYFEKLHGRISVSRPNHEYISKLFPAEYEIIPNGIKLENFGDHVAPLPHLQDGMINLLFFGRLEKRKGLRILLAAYSRLKWDWPNLRLLVVGRGKPDLDSYRILSERNLRDVVFVGGVADTEKARYFRSAEIYCSPATGGESFGIVLLEGMASSVPTVASDIEGYRQVITHGKDGLLVPPKDDAALAEAIDLLLKDRQLRGRLGAAGRLRAEEFRWEVVAGRVMDYYRACIDRTATLAS